MRKFLFLPLLALLASCGKNEDCDIVTPKPEELVSPALYATLSQSSTDPYNGPLEVLPCETNGSIYIGNYTANGKQVPFPAYYLITNGIGKSQKYPLKTSCRYIQCHILGISRPYFRTAGDAALADPTLIIGRKTEYNSV